MRPSCAQILQLPEVRHVSEQLFGIEKSRDDIENTQMQLLQTIKVPKNLLYLTDRLPKPFYEQNESKQISKKANRSSKQRKQKTHEEASQHMSADELPQVNKRYSPHQYSEE